MRPRRLQALNLMLALWVGVGVLSAGFLVHLPELHADLHQHHHDGHSHDHDDHPAHDGDHQCLIQALSDGGAASAQLTVDGLVARISAPFLQIRETRSKVVADAFLVPLGRAPPVV